MEDGSAPQVHPAARSAVPDGAGTLRHDLRAVTGALPGGGEQRPGQLAMAEAVERALASGRHLVAQAGTGTGKTLAYLLPAIRSGATVVVSTATRALQDQLAGSDLPQVQQALGAQRPVRFAVLKGRSNYLCRQRAAEIAGRPSWRSGSDAGTTASSTTDASTTDAGTSGTGSGTPVGEGDGPSVPVQPGTDGGRLLPRRPPVPNPAPEPLPGLDLLASVPEALPGLGPPESLPGFDLPDAAPSAVGPRPAAAAGRTTGAVRASLGAHRAGARGGGDHGAGGDRPGADGGGDHGPGAGDAPAPARLADEVRALLAWAATSQTGDRAELDTEPDPRAWALVSVGPRECPGAFRCPSGDDCFAEQARARAAAAQVVVVNTALLSAHLASGGAVLPEHDALVIDEAHDAEDIIAQGLGVEITPGRLRAAAASARGLVGSGDDPLAPLAASADELQRVLASSEERRVDLGHDADLAALLATARARVDDLTRALRAADDGAGGPEASRRSRALIAAGHLAGDIATAVGDDPDRVLWVAGTERARALRSTPIDVGPVLASRLWPEVTAVLCSATMPPGVAARLGLPRDRTDEVDVGSPFPYRENALLYVPRHLPDRRAPGADDAVHDELAGLMLAAGGRTLALFTSWRAMDAALAAVRPRVPFPVLAQGERPKPRLLSAFADDEASCLFATMSFWQGVDVPGRTASLVVIDRLPFPRPDDPLLQARRDRAGPAAFQSIDLPRAATLLAQGAGRLVRRSTDRGVVAVLDRRLATAGYRAALLAVVPPMRRTVDRQEVHRFLRSIAAGAAAAPASCSGAPGGPGGQ